MFRYWEPVTAGQQRVKLAVRPLLSDGRVFSFTPLSYLELHTVARIPQVTR